MKLPGSNGSNEQTYDHGLTCVLREFQKRASFGPAIVVVQQLDGVALNAVHLIAKVAPGNGLVIGHGTDGHTARHREEGVHIQSRCCSDGAAQCKQSQACDRLLVNVALACP